MIIFKNPRGFIQILIVIILITGLAAGLYLIRHSQIFKGRAAGGPVNYYGRTVATFGLFGQSDIGSATRNKVGTNGMYHSSGVAVDRSSFPNKIYVVDSGNNRILGFNGLDGAGPKTPDLQLGQPDFGTGSCNGDDNLGFTKAPTASTLCLTGYPVGNNTAEQWGRSNIDVDSSGNLYVSDRYNNRVLEYYQPFSADKSGGKGDSVADVVYGQADFASNGPNRNTNPYEGGSKEISDDTLWTGFGAGSDSTGVGVSVDSSGNVWVSDVYNNRLLRFPQGASHADLVIGQSDFGRQGCDSSGASLNTLCFPVVGKVDPDSGDLFVLDNYPSPFRARILVFHPPFTNGMSAYKTIIARQNGNFTNWGGLFGDGKEIFQATGFSFNPDKTDYPAGLLWINEHSDNRTVLIDGDGNILKIIGARSETERGGDSEYGGVCGSIYDGNRLFWPGGSIGFDSANNIYLADEELMTVYRYSLPYNLQGNGCLPDASGVLMPKGGNKPSMDTLSEAIGMTVAGNQLIVQDQHGIWKVWNDYRSKPIGAPADFTVTGGINDHTFMSAATDDSNRLWTYGNNNQIRVYQLPLQPGAEPIKDNISLNWADDRSPVGVQGEDAIAFDPFNKKLYFVNAGGTRILRVSNYQDFASGNLYVDMVIGQTDKTNVKCNQGLGSPNAGTLCQAVQIKFDKLGNLYVVDNTYECHGNDRIVVFTADDLKNASGMFPNLSAKKVFVAPNLNSKGPCAYATVNGPGSPVTVAFNSQNQLVVGNDGYYGDASQRALKQLWFYADPLNNQTPTSGINLYMGTPGEITFDANDNLLIQDHTWYRVVMINLNTDPDWTGNFTIPTEVPAPRVVPTSIPTPVPAVPIPTIPPPAATAPPTPPPAYYYPTSPPPTAVPRAPTPTPAYVSVPTATAAPANATTQSSRTTAAVVTVQPTVTASTSRTSTLLSTLLPGLFPVSETPAPTQIPTPFPSAPPAGNSCLIDVSNAPVEGGPFSVKVSASRRSLAYLLSLWAIGSNRGDIKLQSVHGDNLFLSLDLTQLYTSARAILECRIEQEGSAGQSVYSNRAIVNLHPPEPPTPIPPSQFSQNPLIAFFQKILQGIAGLF